MSTSRERRTEEDSLWGSSLLTLHRHFSDRRGYSIRTKHRSTKVNISLFEGVICTCIRYAHLLLALLFIEVVLLYAICDGLASCAMAREASPSHFE